MGIKNEKANFDPLLIAEQRPVSLLSPSSELRQENQKLVENHKSTNVFDPEAPCGDPIIVAMRRKNRRVKICLMEIIFMTYFNMSPAFKSEAMYIYVFSASFCSLFYVITDVIVIVIMLLLCLCLFS